MSSIATGGANVFIDAGRTQNGTVTFNASGWPGNALIEAQPISPQIRLTCVQGAVEQVGEHYAFDITIHNESDTGGLFNVQLSAS
jgi:hypothetical protein